MGVDIKINGTEFHAGDTVKGEILYNKGQGTKACTGIFFEFVGYEDVLHDLRDPNLHNKEVFYHKKVQLQGGAGTSAFDLRAGIYSWPFKIVLPLNLPPSFQHPSSKCAIKYEVIAEVVLPGAGEKKQRIPVLVTSNPVGSLAPRLPSFDAPQATNKHSRSSLMMNCICDKAIYGQGQEAGIHIHIQNDGNKLVEAIKISIVQSYKYTKLQSEKLLLKEYLFRKIQVHPHSAFDGKLVVKIPENLPPSIIHHRLFSMHYFLVIECIVNVKDTICPVPLPIIVIPKLLPPPPPPPLPSTTLSVPLNPLVPGPHIPPPPPPRQALPPPNSSSLAPITQPMVVMTPQGPMMMVPLANASNFTLSPNANYPQLQPQSSPSYLPPAQYPPPPPPAQYPTPPPPAQYPPPPALAANLFPLPTAPQATSSLYPENDVNSSMFSVPPPSYEAAQQYPQIHITAPAGAPAGSGPERKTSRSPSPHRPPSPTISGLVPTPSAPAASRPQSMQLAAPIDPKHVNDYYPQGITLHDLGNTEFPSTSELTLHELKS